MIILTGILGLLLAVAVVYILQQHLLHWLERRGGFTIKFVVEDDSEF